MIYPYRRHYDLHSLPKPFVLEHVPEILRQVQVWVRVDQLELIDSLFFVEEVVSSIEAMLDHFGYRHIVLSQLGLHRIANGDIIVEVLIGLDHLFIVFEFMIGVAI